MARNISPADVRTKRLLRVATEKLTADDRQFLLRRLAEAKPEEVFDLVVQHTGLFGGKPFMGHLVARLPAAPWSTVRMVAPLLAHRLDADLDAAREAYVELVAAAVPGIRASSNDDRASVERELLQHLRGGHDGYYASVAAAESGYPRDAGSEPLALLLIDVRFDKKECARVLRELVRTGASEALRIWEVARRVDDSDLERAVRPEVLRHVDLAREPDDPSAPPWHRTVRTAVSWWLSVSAPEVWTNDMMACAEAAHARGVAWESLAWLFRMENGSGDAIQRRIFERALDEDERPSSFALGVLREPLSAGESTAWTRLFRWVELEGRHPELLVRELLRGARLPESPDDRFWARYLDAWECGCAGERAQLQLSGGDTDDRHWPLVRTRMRSGLEPLTSAKELIDVLLAHPPTPTSARALCRLLVDEPRRLSDPRVAAFGPFTRGVAHDKVPRVDPKDRLAVATFMGLYHGAAITSLQATMRAYAEYEFNVKWLEEPWFEGVADGSLCNFLRQQTLVLPLSELVGVAEHHPTWVHRDEVAARLAHEKVDKAVLRDLPAWTDDALLERAKASSEEELEAMLPRFYRHERLGDAFREVLCSRLAAGTARQGFSHFVCAPPSEGLPGDEEDAGPWNPAAVERFLAGQSDPAAREVLDALAEHRSNLASVDNYGYVGRIEWRLRLRTEMRDWLPGSLLGRPVHELLRLLETHPSWVSREDVAARIAAGPNRLDVDSLAALPAWVDDVLLERARASTLEELTALLPRFRHHAIHRGAFLQLLRDRIADGTAEHIGKMLENRSAWEKSGPSVVHDLLRLARPRAILDLAACSAEALGPMAGKGPSHVLVAMHYAVAQGVLLWATERASVAAHDDVERALIAIAYLDPPPSFTRDLRRFGRVEGLGAGATEWIKQIHGIAKDHGGQEATLLGIRDCVAELSAKEVP